MSLNVWCGSFMLLFWSNCAVQDNGITFSSFFFCCLSHSSIYYLKARDNFVLILAQPISYFVPGATSEWLTLSALSLRTTTRSTPLCTATEPTGATGTFTASSTWPCSVCGLLFLFPLSNRDFHFAHTEVEDVHLLTGKDWIKCLHEFWQMITYCL